MLELSPPEPSCSNHPGVRALKKKDGFEVYGAGKVRELEKRERNTLPLSTLAHPQTPSSPPTHTLTHSLPSHSPKQGYFIIAEILRIILLRGDFARQECEAECALDYCSDDSDCQPDFDFDYIDPYPGYLYEGLKPVWEALS